MRFLFLDANRPGDEAQKQWLADQLAVPAPPLFTVAVFHQPVFSCGLHGRTPAVIEHWYPMLNSGRVSLVLTGHDHQYERFLTAEGTTYIVTGGGGRDLYPLIPLCNPPEKRAGKVEAPLHGFEVYSDRMALTAVAIDGSVLDQVDIPAALAALLALMNWLTSPCLARTASAAVRRAATSSSVRGSSTISSTPRRPSLAGTPR